MENGEMEITLTADGKSDKIGFINVDKGWIINWWFYKNDLSESNRWALRRRWRKKGGNYRRIKSLTRREIINHNREWNTCWLISRISRGGW